MALGGGLAASQEAPTTAWASRLPIGWSVVGWATLGILLVQAVVVAIYGVDIEGIHASVRWTARTSVLLFSGAFAASSLVILRPGPFTRWMRAVRRQLGVSFAISHIIHLAGIIALFAVEPGFGRPPVVLVIGGLGYVFMFAMLATSFDTTTRWLGPRLWRMLHKTGAWYIWGVFFVSYIPTPGEEISPVATVGFGLVVGSLVARAAAWRRARAVA